MDRMNSLKFATLEAQNIYLIITKRLTQSHVGLLPTYLRDTIEDLSFFSAIPFMELRLIYGQLDVLWLSCSRNPNEKIAKFLVKKATHYSVVSLMSTNYPLFLT